MKDWFIADTHFGHRKVLGYESRPFKSVEEMDETLIKNWNSLVGRTDKVYMLGDFSFHDFNTTRDIIQRLKGYKILVKGNHDRKSTEYWIKAGFNEFSKHPILLPDKRLVLSHEPLKECLIAYGCLNVHGHMHLNSNNDLLKDKYKCVSVEQIGYKPISIVSTMVNEI